jgi:hypothetical protein
MADREWTADCVADHFEEAFRTLRKLPPVKAQGYFNTWPDIVRTSREIARWSRSRCGCGPRPPPSPGSSRPSTGCSGSRGGAQAGLVARARVPWKQISGELGLRRTTALAALAVLALTSRLLRG